MKPPAWPCEAYGPRTLDLGAWCFVSGLWERSCESQAECAAVVQNCRQSIYRRVHELAAGDGNPDFEFLADRFPTPDHIMRVKDISEGNGS